MNGSIRSLLNSLIDYAGLFPPASLDMRRAVQNYTSYQAGEHAWLLGRFIVPVARLEEFESVTGQSPTGGSVRATWRLSVLAGADFGADLAAIANVNRRHAVAAEDHAGAIVAPAIVIDAIEIKATRADEITQAMRRLPAGLHAYFEIPVSADGSLLAASRSSGARVKVRTGGVTAQAFPSCAELAGFLCRCGEFAVPFKATAGLHHPIRSEHRLSYAEDSPRGTMHGFINVFLAAAGVRAGMTADEAERLLGETSPAAFACDDEGISWERFRWTIDRLRTTRQEFAISFGSCSFQEPIDDLKAIGLL